MTVASDIRDEELNQRVNFTGVAVVLHLLFVSFWNGIKSGDLKNTGLKDFIIVVLQ